MNLFAWIENSVLVGWLTTTSWVYPWVISFHSISMAFMVGVIFMVILRVLGFGQFLVAPLERYLLIMRIAFLVSLATGVTLFVIDAQRFFYSPTFIIKPSLIVAGGISVSRLSRRVFRDGAAWAATGGAPAGTKTIAVVSLVCWVGAIAAGRLTAYLP